MIYSSLANYYETAFHMTLGADHHKYSLQEFENLIPFERDLYISMLKDKLEAKVRE